MSEREWSDETLGDEVDDLEERIHGVYRQMMLRKRYRTAGAMATAAKIVRDAYDARFADEESDYRRYE